MREIILKGIQKAQTRGLTPPQTADLIMDYLEIAGEIKDTTVQYNGSPCSVFGGDKSLNFQGGSPASISDEGGKLEAPVQVGKVLSAPLDQNANVWTEAQLMERISSIQWQFEALPEGWKQPLVWKGTPVANPRGMEGVAVIFRCPDVSNPKELPVFFPLSEKVIDPEKTISEMKVQVEQLFRVRSTPIQNTAVARTSFPSDAELMGGGAMYGGNVV